MAKCGYVYIMASRRHGVLYTGITSDLVQRVWQHKDGTADGFTKKYKCKMLVYYEIHGDIETAIAYEKKLKHRNRVWKINLIEKNNSDWKDLYEDIIQ